MAIFFVASLFDDVWIDWLFGNCSANQKVGWIYQYQGMGIKVEKSYSFIHSHGWIRLPKYRFFWGVSVCVVAFVFVPVVR